MDGRAPEDDKELASEAGLFSALLRHWRGRCGLSQLDLSLAAGVSARHISYLETGRSNPSPEMILTLASALGVPLRQTNQMLRAAGHEPVFEDDERNLPQSVSDALELLKRHNEPYPVIIMDPAYNVRDTNRAAATVLRELLGDQFANRLTGPGKRQPGPNLARVTFEPDGASSVLANFDTVGRELLWRIQREVLAYPDDGEMGALLRELTAMPTVHPDWRRFDPSDYSDPALVLHFRSNTLELKFLATLAAFQTPHHVEVERLRIETWFPFDATTEETCRNLSQDPQATH